MKLAPVDYLILAIYFTFVLGIGWRLRKSVESSRDFLTSGRSVPVWITSLAFIAANLGAQEVIGMCASGAKYGIMTSHFYWVGAIPAIGSGDESAQSAHACDIAGSLATVPTSLALGSLSSLAAADAT